MARTRYLKPETASDTTLAEVSRDARLLYRDLWCHMDRQGLTEDDPRLIKRNVFPYDDDLPVDRVAGLLEELVRIGRLIRLTHNGKELLWCPTFEKHQNFHRGEKPRFCIPSEKLELAVRHAASTMQAPYSPQPNTLPSMSDASASTTGTGTGTITGTGTATPPQPPALGEQIRLAKETWLKTLEAFGIHRESVSQVEELEIARGIQASGGEVVIQALEGVRYEKKSEKFDRSDHLNLANILDRSKIMAHFNRAHAKRPRRARSSDRDPSEEVAC